MNALAQGLKALDDGTLEPAELLIRAHLRSHPDDPEAIGALADIAVRCGAFPEAERLLRRALSLDFGSVTLRVRLAKTLHRLGRADEALALLDDAIAGDPGNVIALSFKAAVLGQLRRLDQACATFETLLAHHPGQARAWMNYGYLLKTMGRLADSVAAYRRSIELDPARGEAWWGLANLKTVKFDEADVARLTQALAAPETTDANRINLHFTLGRALGDLGAYRESFDHYASGNRLRNAASPHDPDRVTRDVARSEARFTREFLEARAGAGHAGGSPIFILGMPRSGSTLVEQILASHPLIEGTEELYEIERIALGLAQAGAAWPDRLATLASPELEALGEQYLAATRAFRATDRPWFTDKMPANWAYLGLIHCILPNAKIIDIRRHPLGCGFGNFVQHFHWGINFSYDLNNIGRFYRDYVRMMAHFDAVLPGRVHRIFYEDLVDDTEAEIARLLAYLELPFDAACLRFYDNPRAVHTPSAEQVRQPIGRAGIDFWRNYAPWLGPLEAALGPVLDCYPDVPGEGIGLTT
ncbi:MAG: sulfotransferase [Pseudomonadota bacterium]